MCKIAEAKRRALVEKTKAIIHFDKLEQMFESIPDVVEKAVDEKTDGIADEVLKKISQAYINQISPHLVRGKDIDAARREQLEKLEVDITAIPTKE